MRHMIRGMREGRIRSDNLRPVNKRDVRFVGEMFLRASSNDEGWRNCGIPGCHGKHYGRGVCMVHYHQWKDLW